MNRKISFQLFFVALFLFVAITQTPLVASGDTAYTSLIIDARNLPLARSMSPKVFSDKGYEVYGTIFQDLDRLFEIGVVMYATSLADARNHDPERVGANPMLVQALRLEGPSSSDLVLADGDARSVLEENKRSGFLDKYRVIVLMSPGVAATE